MNTHWGMAAAGVLAVALTTTACTSDDDADRSPTPTTAPAVTTAVPRATASEDPGVQAVPLAGDDHLEIQWTLDKGVNGSDAVVDVGRRTLALVYLATFSPAWRTDAAIRKVSTSLTTGDQVVLEPTRSSRTPPQRTAKGPLLITVQPPEVNGDAAVFWACLDSRGAFDREPLHKTNLGVLASVSVTATGGVWKATKYNLDPKDPTTDERYYQRCQQSE
ncbi:MAG: hypothetical protein QOH03_956 [Kribbellaceae bacterium]|nr:hypothetical protein [Kribbellaceae bacterium]